MVLGPSSEANCDSGTQELPFILFNSKFHKSQHLVPILINMSPVHNFRIYFFNVCFNIILSSTPMSS
jgi:hypothetical protein